MTKFWEKNIRDATWTHFNACLLAIVISCLCDCVWQKFNVTWLLHTHAHISRCARCNDKFIDSIDAIYGWSWHKSVFELLLVLSVSVSCVGMSYDVNNVEQFCLVFVVYWQRVVFVWWMSVTWNCRARVHVVVTVIVVNFCIWHGKMLFRRAILSFIQVNNGC